MHSKRAEPGDKFKKSSHEKLSKNIQNKCVTTTGGCESIQNKTLIKLKKNSWVWTEASMLSWHFSRQSLKVFRQEKAKIQML